jgi:hypothetical protein
VSRWGEADYDVLYEKGVAACRRGHLSVVMI